MGRKISDKGEKGQVEKGQGRRQKAEGRRQKGKGLLPKSRDTTPQETSFILRSSDYYGERAEPLITLMKLNY